MFRARQQPIGQLRNRLRLVTGGLVGRDKFEHATKVGRQPVTVNAGFGIETVRDLRKLVVNKP